MDIGSLTGDITLNDTLSSGLEVAMAKVEQFAEFCDIEFGVVGIAAGVAAAAIAGITYAVVELGEKGAEVNDVSNTLDQFAGSAENASNILSNLQKGTLDTVDDFELMKSSAKLLAGGVKLTAEDFGTLGSAAFALQNQGLGPTKNMLDLVSSSLMTGRTRSLEMAIGKIDLVAAERKYADSLGVTIAALTPLEQTEAKRGAIMDALRQKVKDGGAVQRDFGEQIEFAHTQISDFVDSLAQQVAASPAVMAALDGIGAAFKEVFGGSQQDAIKTVMKGINEFAVLVMDAGLAGVETARVFHVAWSAIETVVLGVETAVAGLATGIIEVIAKLVSVEGKLHLVDQSEVDRWKDFALQSKAVTVSLAQQTAEVAKGIVGHSEFDKTLDHLGGTLMNARDKVVQGANAVTSATATVKKHGEAVVEVTALTDAQVAATTKLWEDYGHAVADASHNTTQKQIDEVWRSANAQIAAMEKARTITVEDYNIIWATAQQTYDNIIQKTLESDNYTREHYEMIADQAKIKLDFALDHVSSYTEQEIRMFREAYSDAERNSNRWASTARDDMDKVHQKAPEVVEAVKTITKSYTELQEAAEKAEAATRKLYSFTYDLTTRAGVEQYRSMNTGMEIQWSDDQLIAFAKKGGTLQQLMQMGVIHMKAFAEGGPVTEDGPIMAHAGEYVVPAHGALIGGGGGDKYEIHLYGAMRTEREVIDMVNRGITQVSGRKFSRANRS